VSNCRHRPRHRSKIGHRFIIGIGFSLKALWDEGGPNVGPLNPENLLIFANGPLTGMRARYSSRIEVTTDADGLFIGCLNFRAHDAIQALENYTGRPVVTSSQATLWAVLRLAGIRDSIAGYGKLMLIP
jgi:hypothetical protein